MTVDYRSHSAPYAVGPVLLKRTFARPFDDKPSRQAVACPFGLRLLQSTFFFSSLSSPLLSADRQMTNRAAAPLLISLASCVCVFPFSLSIYPCGSTLSPFRVKVIRYHPPIHLHPLTSNPSLSSPKFLSCVLRSSGTTSPFLPFSPSFQLTAGPPWSTVVLCNSIKRDPFGQDITVLTQYMG